jgi:hypothetical protein
MVARADLCAIAALPRLLLNLVRRGPPRCFYVVHPHFSKVREQGSSLWISKRELRFTSWNCILDSRGTESESDKHLGFVVVTIPINHPSDLFINFHPELALCQLFGVTRRTVASMLAYRRSVVQLLVTADDSQAAASHCNLHLLESLAKFTVLC